MRIKSNLKSKSFCEAQDSCETTEKKEIFVCEEYYMEDSLCGSRIFLEKFLVIKIILSEDQAVKEAWWS